MLLASNEGEECKKNERDTSLCRIMGLVRGVFGFGTLSLSLSNEFAKFCGTAFFSIRFSEIIWTQVCLKSSYACGSLVHCVGFMLDLDPIYLS